MLRRLLATIGLILLVILVAIPLLLWLFVDPDDLRARAAAYVKEHTGRELTIGGPVRLSFFPWLGAEMREVALGHPGQTRGEPFATFAELGVTVRLVPLLRRTVEVGGVTASGGVVRVSGAQGTAYELRNVLLKSGAFGAEEPTDLSLSFDVTGAGPTLPVLLRSRMVLDLPRQLLDLTDLTLHAGDTTMTGSVQGRQVVDAPTWDVALKADRLDADRFLPLLAAPAPAAATVDGRAARPMTARADLEVGRLRASGLEMADVAVSVVAQDGVVTAKPFRGSMYGGTGDFTMTLDGRRRIPTTRVAGKMLGVDLAPMLRDLQQLQALSGTGEVALDLTVRGTDAAEMRRSMTGEVTANVRDGQIDGADFVKMLVQAHAMAAQLRGRPAMASVEPGDATSFSRLAGRALLRGGVATIQDLVIESPLFRATGDGTADLAGETLDVQLRATSRETADLVVPIAITGPFSAPRYSIQAGEILKEAAKEELERQIKRGLQRLLKKP
jgi:uncharacterized protein involved in outer membrane biogenesis